MWRVANGLDKAVLEQSFVCFCARKSERERGGERKGGVGEGEGSRQRQKLRHCIL